LNGVYAAASWFDAAATLSAEAEELARLDASCTDEESFDEAAFEAQAEMFLTFEFGINGTVEALCAAGCPTFASCAGHGEGFGGRSRYPWVLFAADPLRLPLLLTPAQGAGCGLELDERGLLVLYGPSVLETVRFGLAVVGMKSGFDELPQTVDPQDAVPATDDDHW
jgi:hypothetical protein